MTVKLFDVFHYMTGDVVARKVTSAEAATYLRVTAAEVEQEVLEHSYIEAGGYSCARHLGLPKVPPDFLSNVKNSLGSGYFLASAKGEDVSLPASWVRILLALAERAPKARSRPPLTLKQKRRETWVLFRARKREAELRSQGMAAEAASTKAAKEAVDVLQGEGRDVSLITIKDRMRRRKR